MNDLEECVFKRATAHQRGHTCWFDTAIVILANTFSMRMVNSERKDGDVKFFKRRISDQILHRGGLSEYSDKLQKTISSALGDDVCPLKPKEGSDMLSFLKALLGHIGIDYIILKVPSVSNTPSVIIGSSENTCERVGTIDIDIFIEENLSKMVNKTKGTNDSGVLMVQSRGNDTGCLKLDCSFEKTINTPYGDYTLSLSSISVSNRGHVISYGKCRTSSEWVVFDNEFTGMGYDPRTFSAENFDMVKNQMFNFPHTYFDPKHGTVPMNPFFKEGIRSSTIFVYDFFRFED